MAECNKASSILAGVIAAIAFAGLPFAAAAGECPADKKLTKARDLPNIAEKFLKRETLAEVKLEGWRKVGNLLLRQRRLTIQPGGFVPTHYHDDRPSIVFVVSGELIEHSSYCSVPIVHRAGEYTPEFGDFHGHWWENKGSVPAVVLSSDVIPPEYRDLPDM